MENRSIREENWGNKTKMVSTYVKIIDVIIP